MPTTVPEVAFSDQRLDNGLRVIVAEDHLAPVVAVNLWYDVGSKHEVTGKTGFAHLLDLPDAKKLAQVNPGDTVELTPEGNRLIAISNGMRIGIVEPRVAARLLKLIADGNKYLAGELRLLRGLIERLQQTTLVDPGRQRQSLHEHRELLTAIRERDAAGAEDIARRHFQRAMALRLASPDRATSHPDG